jgi:hypothetical protein
MHPQASGPDIIERSSAEFLAVCADASVNDHDLEPCSVYAVDSILDAAAQNFNWPSRPSAIRVFNNIGQSFIYSTGQGTALPRGKPKVLGQAHYGGAHHRQNFGVCGQFEPEEPCRTMQLNTSHQGHAGQTTRKGAKRMLVQSRFWSNKSPREQCGNAEGLLLAKTPFSLKHFKLQNNYGEAAENLLILGLYIRTRGSHAAACASDSGNAIPRLTLKNDPCLMLLRIQPLE